MDREFFNIEDHFNKIFDPSLSPSNERFIQTRRCVVAIPVKDEEQRLPACLIALAAQRGRHGGPLDPGCFGIVVFANNCRDGSADLAGSLGQRLSLPIRVVEASLPLVAANAGNARRAAMDIAEAWLGEERVPDGVILTTDADSRVAADWISKNLSAIDDGADAVLGGIALDEEGDLLPEALHRRGQLESVYEALLTEVSALLDPLAYNPWPHHATISGASIAVTREAYLRVGGLPRVPLGEDKALVAELIRHDAKIRFCPEVRVTTSGRLDGRAPGGVADTLRLRSNDPAAFCDGLLEPFRVAIKRAKWRARLRGLRSTGKLDGNGAWARELDIPASDAQRICRAPSFGAAWSAIEYQSPLFTRRLLTPAELPDQISGARRALARLRRRRLSAREHVQPEFGVPVCFLNLRSVADCGDEEACGLVAV
jgi:cellulose synthase/poly-beta-1,6-N-acetylglucosamine synthase-like glycosyltransferase